jgi:hypothetical protein
MSPSTGLAGKEQLSSERAYRVRIGWKVFFGLFGSAFVVGGFLGTWYFGAGHSAQGPAGTTLLVFLSIAFGLMGLYTAVWSFRARVVFREDGIECRGACRTGRLSRDEIAGWRTLQQKNGPPDFVLLPRSNHVKKMRLSQMLNFDLDFLNWLEQFPNLDQRDQESSLRGILANPEFGGSTEQRSEKLKAARKIATGSMLATIGIAAWGWIYPLPYGLVITILVVVPIVAMFIALGSNGLYRLDKNKNDIHPDLAIPFILPGFILLLRMVLDFEFVSWGSVLVMGLLLGVVICWFSTLCDKNLRMKIGMQLGVLTCMSIYGVGAVLAADTLLDRSDSRVYSTHIVRKYVVHGKHTDYRLELSPWGPLDHNNSVSVSRGHFESVMEGEQVCTFLRNGALRIAWYSLGPCPRE